MLRPVELSLRTESRQMTDNVKLVPRCDDAQVLKLFGRLVDELDFYDITYQIYGSETSIKLGDKSHLTNELIAKRGFSVRRAQALRRSDEPQQTSNIFSLTFERGKHTKPGALQLSLHTDSATFNHGQHIHPTVALKLNDVIDAELGTYASPALTGISRDVLEELSSNHQEFLNGMRRQLSAVGEELTHARIDAERELRDRKRALQDLLERERATLANEHKERLDAIEKTKAQLAERERQLDDRNNTHARRDLQKNLQEHLASYKTKFELTEGTRKLRQPVIWTVVIIESTCVLLLAFLFSATPTGGDFWDRAFFWLKSVGLTFLAAATAVWFLRWLTQWSARHADAEFQLRQLELDIGRASWVVETTLEWKVSQDRAIPEPLLNAISRNLFAAGEGRNESTDSPADHLASALLGEASKLKLKTGDHEIEFDRAGIKRAKKSHNTD